MADMADIADIADTADTAALGQFGSGIRVRFGATQRMFCSGNR